MKRLVLLSLMALCITPTVFADFGDVLIPTAIGAGIGGAAGGGRGAAIGAGVGFGVGALSSSARDRYYYDDDGYYYDDGYYVSGRPWRYGRSTYRPYRYRTTRYIR